MAEITSPSGRVYQWNKPTPPTKDDIDALVAYDSSVGGTPSTPAQPSAPVAQLGSDAQLQKAVNESASVGEMRRREGEGEIAARRDRTLLETLSAASPVNMSPLGVGFVPPISQSDIQANAAAAREIAPIVAGMAAPELLPAKVALTAAAGKIVPKLLSSVGIGTVSGVAQQATEEAVSGFQPAQKGEFGPLGRIVESAGLGGLLGATGVAIERFGPTAYQYAKNILSPKKFATTAYRPFGNASVSQLEASAARQTIQDTTGIDVPVGVGEAIGTPQLANEIKNIQSGLELSSEAKDAIKRQVAFSATQLKNTFVTEEDLAKHTIATLRQQIGDLSKPVNDAIEAASKELHPAIQSAFKQVQNDALALVPGTSATPTSFGAKVRSEIQGTFSDLSAGERTAFQKVTSNPDYKTVDIPTGNTKKWSEDLGIQTVQQDIEKTDQFSNILDSFGRLIAKPEAVSTRAVTPMFPVGTGRFSGSIPKFSENQTLEGMRNFRTQVGGSIGNDTIFPGVSDYQKKQLYKAVSQDIEAGIASLPGSTLKTDLQQANSLTKQKYATFDNPMMDKILKDFGPEGGIGPASLAAKLRSADGPSFLAELKKSVPPARAKAITDATSEYLFNDIGNAARNSISGEISAGQLLNGIDSLAPEIRAEFFPNYKNIVDLAKKQNALSKVDPKKIISNLSVDDPALLFDALGAAPSKDVTDKIVNAFAKSQKLQKQYNGTVIGALKEMDGDGLSAIIEQNPSKFMRSIMDGETFSPSQTEKAMRIIATHNPELIKHLQFNFVNDLLSRSTGQGRISANNLLKEILPESPLGKAGSMRGISEAVLGPNKLNTLESTLRNLSAIEKAGGDLSPNSPLMDLVARGVGAAAGAATRGMTGIGTIGAANELASIAGRSQKIKYAIASYILTTPELRKLAITPINRIDPTTAKNVINGFSNYMIDRFGPDSPEADEIHTMNIDANRRSAK